MWTDYFWRIFLVSLPEREEKRELVSKQLIKYGIPFNVMYAIKNLNGNLGLLMTMRNLFLSVVTSDKPVLVFEDDVKFLRDPGPVMEKCIEGLKEMEWDLFHLGPNTHEDFGQLVKSGILQLKNAFSTHAVAYSPAGIKKMLKLFPDGRPIDVMIAQEIQTLGNCYCSYPMIATQRDGYSDIEHKEVISQYIEERFVKHTKHLA